MLIYSKTEFLQKDTVKNRQNALKPKNKFSWNMQRLLSLSLSLFSKNIFHKIPQIFIYENYFFRERKRFYSFIQFIIQKGFLESIGISTKIILR